MIPSGQSWIFRLCALVALTAILGVAAKAQPPADVQLRDASRLMSAFIDAGGDSIPPELLQRAQGIAVIPNVFRGGLILGARRGRGVMSLRMDDGSWSNPTFVALTGGSIGWQFGAESTDIVLVFANENAIKNIASGKFTLGGEATAIAGPLRKQASSTVTFRAEVYGYARSRGLYAGAAFQGARLRVDEDLARSYYRNLVGVEPLGRQTAATPHDAQNFLTALDRAEYIPPELAGERDSRATTETRPGSEADSRTEARTFALPD
jgi:lipid-binding SYLF domain-containing protein